MITLFYKYVMRRIFNHIILYSVAFLLSCSPGIPGSYDSKDVQPGIYPDYKDVTVPCNISPLTFRVEEAGDASVVRFAAGSTEYITEGPEAVVSVEEWKALLAAAAGSSITVDVFVEKDGKWSKFAPFCIVVSKDSIDPYISYRLIPPSYVAYENLSISQRNLENYDEEIIYHNRLVVSEPDGQCINCHAYKNYSTDNMQFHVRQYNGGTVFVHDGKVKKLDMKTDSTISAGVYPFFNPVYDIVAYSVNSTGQIFHTQDHNKVEVQDQYSDVIVYNPVKETIAHVSADPDDLEVFPAWSPDGKTLYYCVSKFPEDSLLAERVAREVVHYKDIKYDIVRRPWNPDTGEFGEVDTVFCASALGKSATFPRVSPNGKYVLFALGEYGCFHIWHKDADLYLLNLENGAYWPLEKANSDFPESYHSWSSNGKWILFASRREDTNYSRLYIAHVNDDGTSDKAFLLPQESADYYDFFDRSYNVPEFMKEPVTITPQEFVEVVEGDAVKVKYSSNIK